MKKTLYIRPEHATALRLLGDGNVSAGIRVALAMAAQLEREQPGLAQSTKRVALAPVTKETNQ